MDFKALFTKNKIQSYLLALATAVVFYSQTHDKDFNYTGLILAVVVGTANWATTHMGKEEVKQEVAQIETPPSITEGELK